jgi:glutamyl-tRNA synthetase
VSRAIPFLREAGLPVDDHDAAWVAGILRPEIERCRLLSDFAGAIEFYFRAPEAYESKGVKKVFAGEGVVEILNGVADWVESVGPNPGPDLEEGLRGMAEGMGVGFAKVAQPTRLALTGRTTSPGLFDVINGLGAAECARRLRLAAERIEAGAVKEA